MVNLLLELGARKPSLITAISSGNLGMVRFLIDKGVPVNPNDRLQGTALSLAATQGHVEIVQLLVDNGADVEAVNPDRIEYATAFVGAAFFAREDAVRILLKHGADVNKIVDKELFCALTAALEPSKPPYLPKVDAKVASVVKLLCAAGANLSVLSSTDRARVEAYVHGRPACVLM